ncbi:hypothetical protein J7E96_19880 [Streptomyces sp. ISL-96]|uniref:hypothetical protein n=1 Tax=Streptomyces sp. ISL-96 TaxID=2819191 RepID=UPI001BECB023|nr:hypothetical protein [Streptomyces sp. ISL-96]MBT2490734.1 hypothetical protein [Streptomyces sp. ISL-96]
MSCQLGLPRSRLCGSGSPTSASEIMLECADQRGKPERVRTCRAAALTAAFRRGPADCGTYSWIQQPSEGTWWCY